MNTLCSIIIPVFNGEKFIKETLLSCLMQSSIEVIEIIVVDDCSTDASNKVIQSVLGKSDKMKLICNEDNLGITKSVNKAASIAKGKFLLVLGHDDLLNSDHVENMATGFSDNISLVYCNSIIIDDKGRTRGSPIYKRKFRTLLSPYLKSILPIVSVIQSTGLMMNKAKFDEVGGFNEKFRNYGEWALWLSLLNIGKGKYKHDVVAKYRLHSTNITNTFLDKKVLAELNIYYDFCRELGKENLKGREIYMYTFFWAIINTKRFISKCFGK